MPIKTVGDITYNKPANWNGKDLKGKWLFTIKKDGVRCFVKDGVAFSRADKPLNNIPVKIVGDGDYEVFITDWNETVSRVRTHDKRRIGAANMFSIDPLDDRLIVGHITDPTADEIRAQLEIALAAGHEGLVLRKGKQWIKVKPRDNHDIAITGIKLGTGRIDGLLGAFVTDMGKIGTGFTDKQRKELLDTPIGTVIEISCRGLTKAGKFKEPAFERLRFDKSG